METTPKTRAAVELVGHFSPAQTLALTRAVPKTSAEEARAAVLEGVHGINLRVHLTGDIEIRDRYLRREPLDTNALLLGALQLLTPAQRQTLYKGVRPSPLDQARLEAELETLKVELPRHWADGPLVPHLKVALL